MYDKFSELYTEPYRFLSRATRENDSFGLCAMKFGLCAMIFGMGTIKLGLGAMSVSFLLPNFALSISNRFQSGYNHYKY